MLADLYSKTYYKVIDDTSSLNRDPLRNKIQIRHVPGSQYTDLLITCLLDYGEPATQAAFDNSANMGNDPQDAYVFDELGLKGWNGVSGEGRLLTHVVFHPVQKSLNRLIQIEYTIRIQTLTSLSSNA